MAPAGSTILTEGVLRGVIDDTTVAVFGGLVAGRGGLETAERNKDNLVKSKSCTFFLRNQDVIPV